MTEKPVKTAEEYIAERAAAAEPRKVSSLSELERAQLGPAAVRAMQAREDMLAHVAEKHAAAAAAAAKDRAVVATLPSWIEAKAIGWDHRGQKIEVESDNPPLPLGDRVLLRLTRRMPRPTPNMTGNVGSALAKLGADSQTFSPAESRWLACGGLIKVPVGKSVVVWCLHRPLGVALNDADLSKGYTLDAPRQYAAGYEGEITVLFHNGPERILQLGPGHFVAIAELVDQ